MIVIKSTSSGAQLSSIRERKSLLPKNNSRPGEIFLFVRNAGQPAALDVTVTSPFQPSFFANTSEKFGLSLSAAENRKYEQEARIEAKLEFN